jgi:hypothetical protein
MSSETSRLGSNHCWGSPGNPTLSWAIHRIAEKTHTTMPMIQAHRLEQRIPKAATKIAATFASSTRFEQLFRDAKVARLEKKMRNMKIEETDKHDQRAAGPTSLRGIARREGRHNFHSVIGDG